MKKYLVSSIILLILLILIGYSKKDTHYSQYVYTGENNSWKATCISENMERYFIHRGQFNYKSRYRNLLVVGYKGELSDLSSVKTLEISYDTGNQSGGSMTRSDYGLNTRIFSFDSGGTGGNGSDDTSIIKITINLDGNTQTLELTYQKHSHFLIPPRSRFYAYILQNYLAW